MATGIPKTKRNGNGANQAVSALNSEMVLAYAGKQSEQAILDTAPASLIRLWPQAASFGQQLNQLYFGDNLPVLSSLLHEGMANKVQLIYIDPPFSSNSVFKSRAQHEAYHDLLAGPEFIEFIRQRLILLRELLADTGSIYVHIDDRMAFHIKLILDEVFGAKNFRNAITRRKCNPKNYTRRTYGNVSDYIFFYTKSDRYSWNRPYEEWTPERAEKEYDYVEAETGRRYKKVPLHAPGERHGETGKPWRGIAPPPGKHWQYLPSTLDEMDARGEIYWSSNGNPRRKVYLDQNAGVPIQDIWLDVRDAHNQNIAITGYPTEKNPALLERVIHASSNPGDLVLDCFAGSGTTLAVASQTGRQWIGVDNSPEALKTILRRFAKGLEPMGDFVSQRNRQQPETDVPRLFELEPEITDFGLWAAQPYQHELSDLLTYWQQITRIT